MALTLTESYRDALGNIHLRFSLERPERGPFKGEAVFDPRLERVILGEECNYLPRESVLQIKRAIHDAYGEETQEETR